HEEDWLADAIKEGRRKEFAEHGWAADVPDPQDRGTVTASTLDWEEVGREPHARMLDWYRTLLRLRRELPALRQTPLGEGEVCREPADEGAGELLTVRRGDVVVLAVLGEGRAGRAVGGEVLASFGQVEERDGQVAVGGDSVVVLGGAP